MMCSNSCINNALQFLISECSVIILQAQGSLWPCKNSNPKFLTFSAHQIANTGRVLNPGNYPHSLGRHCPVPDKVRMKSSHGIFLKRNISLQDALSFCELGHLNKFWCRIAIYFFNIQYI